MIFGFIEEHGEYPAAKWARYFGVSGSGYYGWKNERGERALRNEAYEDAVLKVFRDSNGTYGAERICGKLRKDGRTASVIKVKRIMDKHGLMSIHLRYRKSLTDSRRSRGKELPNHMRNRVVERPFEAVTSDISYIPTESGMEYLCKIRDVASGVVLAAKMGDTMKKELVMDTIKIAQQSYNLPGGTIFHSDRGSQYTAAETMELVRRLGFRQSFSRVGKPGDNAWSESFFSIIKKELVHPVRFKTRDEARMAVFAYIHGFYNTRRIQKRLNYMSPSEWLDNYYTYPLKNTA